jgi:hypothetical protein
MALMKQTVTLEIIYDDNAVGQPVRWSFARLLRVFTDDVKVLDSTTPKRAKDETDFFNAY